MNHLHPYFTRARQASALLATAALLAATALLSACGGGNTATDGTAASPSALRAAAQPHLRAAPLPPVATVVALTKVSETRVSRTVYDYVFRVTLQNGDTAHAGVVATLTGTGTGTTVMDGAVAAGDLAASANVTPTDTITLRQDRTYTFDAASLVWSITTTTPSIVFFEDNFTDAALAQWTQQTAFSNCCGAGNPAVFTLQNSGVTDPAATDGSYLKVDMAGGSCGYCGIPDGSYLKPVMTGVTGDVVAEMRYKEVSRQPLGGGLNSITSIGMQVNFTPGVSSLGGAGSSGDGSPWANPDGSTSSTYAVFGVFGNGTITRIDDAPQTFHTIVLQFERTGDTAVWRAQINNDGVWHTLATTTILSSVPITPSITVGSGHWIGYPTVYNGGAQFLVDYLRVYRR